MDRSDYEDFHKAQSLRVPDASLAVERRKVGFLEYEKNGRMLGALLKKTSYMSAAGSGVALFLALFGRRFGVSFAPGRLLWSSFFGGVGSLSSFLVGSHYLHKEYFNDPEVIERYRKFFEDHSFMESLRRFTWDNIYKLVTPHEISLKVYAEIETLAFDAIWRKYGGDNLNRFIHDHIIAVSFLSQRWTLESAACSASSWDPCLVRRVHDYGHWLVSVLGVSKDSLISLLMSDKFTAEMSFRNFIDFGGLTLFVNGFVARDWMHYKFQLELNSSPELTFAQVKQRYGPWILDYDIASPIELADLFLKQIQMDDFTALIDTYGDWPLRKYQNQLILDIQINTKFSELSSELNDIEASKRDQTHRAEETCSKKVDALHREFTAAEASIISEFNTSIENITNITPKQAKSLAQTRDRRIEEAAARRKSQIVDAEADRDNQLADVEATYRKDRMRVNKEWKNFLISHRHYVENIELKRERAAHSPSVNVVVNVGAQPIPPPQHFAPELAYVQPLYIAPGSVPSAPPE